MIFMKTWLFYFIQGRLKRLPIMFSPSQKIASIRFVTSLTGAFKGNFVDFQSHFFQISSYCQVSFLLSISFLFF